jgi:uncharacterized Zn-binding protein involved in type VI secretion
MGQFIVRLGDTSSHGGTIITASSNLKAEGKFVARIGDLHQCPILGHGTTAIVTGSSKTINGGKGVARNGDTAACGAVLIASATKTKSG